jgi:hypothetical protein
MNNPCEKHLNVRASDGYCPICLLDEIAQLRAALDEMREMLKDTQTTLNYIGENTDDIVLAEAAYGQEKEAAAVLAKYPGGEK